MSATSSIPPDEPGAGTAPAPAAAAPAARRPARRTLRWLIGFGGLCAASAAFALAVAGLTRAALRPRRRPLGDDRLDGLVVEDVEFTAVNGPPLRGWFVPTVEPRGVIICCHGYRGDRGSNVPHARFLTAAGYSCLLFDFRGAGKSEGDVCTFGFHEAEDVRGAIRYLRLRPDTARLPIGGLGLSMGGVALLLAAPEEPLLRAIVADGVYPSLAQAIRRRCELMFGPIAGLAEPIINGVVRRHLGTHPREVSPLGVVERLDDRPTLFIHAEKDIYIDEQDAEEFLTRSAEPKSLLRVSQAMHCRGVQQDPEAYGREVVSFFRAHGL